MTYRELLKKGEGRLKDADIAEYELDARLLLEFVCGTDRNYLLAHGEDFVGGENERRYKELIGKRSGHVPLQHLTKSQCFMGLDFQVDEHVLIPRQDTEILVEEVLRELHDGMRILDMCTGSGCILISILHYSNFCRGVGADISEEALALAERNAKKLLDAPVDFVKSDLFERITGKYEIIVSNPPYIRRNVIPTLMPEVRDYDPVLALDGGEDGLFFYKKIVAEGREFLCGGGKLYFEIGADQAKDVASLMETAGFAEIHVVKDYAGLDRVVYGTYIN